MALDSDVSVLLGMTDREIREAIRSGGARGKAVLAAMLREREGNPPSPIGGFPCSNTTQLDGEMLICRRQNIEHVKAMDVGEHGNWGGCLARTPAGEVLLLDAYGRLARSPDGGRTWSDPVRIEVPGGAWNVFGALGALRNGTLLVSTMSHRDKVTGTIDGFVSRSTDGGQTWSQPFLLDRLGYPLCEPASHLRFIELRDNTIILSVSLDRHLDENSFLHPNGSLFPPSGNFIAPPAQDHDQYVIHSRDGGRTWSKPVLLAAWGNETNFVELPSGKIIATIRYQREWAVEGDDPRVVQASKPVADPDFCTTIFIDTFVAESTDGGYTWSEPRKASRYLEHPSDIVRVSDGTLAMVIAHKAFPQGPQVIWSLDEGRTWSEQFILLHMDPRGGAGQPSAIVLDDDTIVASYDRLVPKPDSTTTQPAMRYQLWVARFKLPPEARMPAAAPGS